MKRGRKAKSATSKLRQKEAALKKKKKITTARKQIAKSKGLTVLKFLLTNCRERPLLAKAILKSGDEFANKIIQEACVNLVHNDQFNLSGFEYNSFRPDSKFIKRIADAKDNWKCTRAITFYVNRRGYRKLLYLIDSAIKRMP